MIPNSWRVRLRLFKTNVRIQRVWEGTSLLLLPARSQFSNRLPFPFSNVDARLPRDYIKIISENYSRNPHSFRFPRIRGVEWRTVKQGKWTLPALILIITLFFPFFPRICDIAILRTGIKFSIKRYHLSNHFRKLEPFPSSQPPSLFLLHSFSSRWMLETRNKPVIESVTRETPGVQFSQHTAD